MGAGEREGGLGEEEGGEVERVGEGGHKNVGPRRVEEGENSTRSILRFVSSRSRDRACQAIDKGLEA